MTCSTLIGCPMPRRAGRVEGASKSKPVSQGLRGSSHNTNVIPLQHTLSSVGQVTATIVGQVLDLTHGLKQLIADGVRIAGEACQ